MASMQINASTNYRGFDKNKVNTQRVIRDRELIFNGAKEGGRTSSASGGG